MKDSPPTRREVSLTTIERDFAHPKNKIMKEFEILYQDLGDRRGRQELKCG